MMPPETPDLEESMDGYDDGEEIRSPKRRRRRRRIVIAFLLVLLLALGGTAGYGMWAIGGKPTGKKVRIVIPKGSNASQITEILGDASVIRAPWLFRVYLRWRGGGTELRPGEYVLSEGLGYASVVGVLRKGPPLQVLRVTVPEGKTLKETARIFEDRARIPARDFLAAAASRKPPVKAPSGASLEGFLFPKTYDLTPTMKAGDVIDRLLGQFRTETSKMDFVGAPLRLSPFQIVTVASLIEREAKVKKDRPLIAAVIYNRLKRHMRLEIDATVQYALLQRTGRYKNPLTLEDLKIRSPYNTYLIDALPPGAIASPGAASIEAALHPADVPYLFYVVKNSKGEHAFATTFSEFQRLKRETRSAR